MPDFMNTREVADYLRIKERKVYDLVRRKAIPCSRVTGKWLFPKTSIDLWVLRNLEHRGRAQPVQIAPVVAGSHDLLLSWAVSESGCELAMLTDGSLDGVQRLAQRQCIACGLHVLAPENGRYNVDLVNQSVDDDDWVLLQWAWREQGLILPAGNPRRVEGLADVVREKLSFMDRQAAAGSRLLLDYLLGQSGLSHDALNIVDEVARNETDVASAVQAGKAEAAFGIRAVAHQFQLDFLRLHRERYDLAVDRRQYFGEAFQRLLAFTADNRFSDKARELSGYDITGLGRVVYNA